MVLKNITDALNIINNISNKQKSKNNKKEQEIIQNNVVQLPLWPEETRALPNVVARSALFGVVRRGKRRYIKREPIASISGVEITYTGEQLDQGDLDVWLAMLHITRSQELGKEYRFSAYAILKLLGKTYSGKSYDTLDMRITRMKATAVEIGNGRYSYEGSLIDSVYRDKETKEYVVILNNNLVNLFGKDQYTLLDFELRNLLDGHQLAQWLQAFYATHAEPYPISVSKLRQLCGSDTLDLWKFRQSLKDALKIVSDGYAKQKRQFSFSIENDLVFVESDLSKSQKWHVKKAQLEGKKR